MLRWRARRNGSSCRRFVPVVACTLVAIGVALGGRWWPGFAIDHAQASAAAVFLSSGNHQSDDGPRADDKPARGFRDRGGNAEEGGVNPPDVVIDWPAEMRIAVATPGGIFLVYDAIVPPDAQGASAGYLAYWLDAETATIFVYGRPIYEWVDVGHALLSLQADTGWVIDPPPDLAEAVEAAREERADAAIWQPATRPLLFALMGFEARQDLDAEPLLVPGWVVPQDEEELVGGVSGCPIENLVDRPPPPPPARLSGEGKESTEEGIEYWIALLGGVAADIRCPGGCDDENPCTDDACNPRSCSCVHTANRHPCTSDGNPCTDDRCSNKVCTHVAYPDDPPHYCQDEDLLCTINDKCVGGRCVGEPNPCDDENLCTTDSCVQGEGCKHVDKCPGQYCCDGGEDFECCDVPCCSGACCGECEECVLVPFEPACVPLCDCPTEPVERLGYKVPVGECPCPLIPDDIPPGCEGMVEESGCYREENSPYVVDEGATEATSFARVCCHACPVGHCPENPPPLPTNCSVTGEGCYSSSLSFDISGQITWGVWIVEAAIMPGFEWVWQDEFCLGAGCEVSASPCWWVLGEQYIQTRKHMVVGIDHSWKWYVVLKPLYKPQCAQCNILNNACATTATSTATGSFGLYEFCGQMSADMCPPIGCAP